MSAFRRKPDSCWPELIAAAAVGATAGILVARNLFPEGKKLRKLVTASYAIGDETFIRSMGQLLGPPLMPGNAVKALHNGEQIFPAMLDAIAGAQQTITFENFIFWSGRLTRQFAAALADRARAGVRVHFLQDAFGCDCRLGEEFDELKRAGVELEIYRSVHLTRINHRTHRKLLIVDGAVGFVGGAGIADVWKGRGDRPGEWRDSHYCVRGPAVAQMQQAFNDNWMMTRGEILHGDDYFPTLKPAGGFMCQVFKSSADEGSDSARLMLMLSIAAARRTVKIANAYFLPDDLTIQSLIAARRRGVEIEVIVPGVRTDERWFRLVSRERWRVLLESGVRFFEFQPTNFHCKYMIVDDCWVSVGSTNLDNRSLRLNEECNLNVLDRDFAAEHGRMFENDKARAMQVTLQKWHRRPWRERLAAAPGLLLRGQL